MKLTKTLLLGAALLGLGTGCGQHDTKLSRQTEAMSSRVTKPLDLALGEHTGDAAVDKEIRRLQEQVRGGRNRAVALERLGWAFVTKARTSFDPGYYKLAEACANVLESDTPGCAAGMLLHGHVLHNLHRFKEAEPIARALTTQRGSPSDFGLLGDVLMEQGQLDAAVDAYQKMVDLSPDSRAYARVAHMRWLKGDLEGAVSAMQVAVEAAGSRDTESAAWMQTRLAFYQFQAGNIPQASRACNAALALQKNYAPAQLIRGRIFLVEGKSVEAAEQFREAINSNPLPEYYWAAIEALTAAGQPEEAGQAKSLLNRHGAVDDPRTYALFLATQEVLPKLALQLATAELQQRADIFTYDCLAWAQCAAGDVAAARQTMARALAEGTRDARLLLHAAIIAERAGDAAEAKSFLEKTYAQRHLLWPSERKHLEKAMTTLVWKPEHDSAPVAVNQSSGTRP